MTAAPEPGPEESAALRTAAAAAIRQASDELRYGLGAAHLFGFALCTDDDVRTLYPVACTREWVAQKNARYADIGFIYVEWPLSASDAYFDPISSQLAALADTAQASPEEWGAARDRRFQTLVRALKDCRDSGVFAADTLLCVGSTDPSSHLEALAMHAVVLLNAKPVADQFAQALGYAKYRPPGATAQ